MSVIVRVATRKSALALAQTRLMIDALRAAAGVEMRWEELHVVTEGDRVQDRPLYEVGGKGLFIKELERALLEGAAELAIHSMKDLPAVVADGLSIVCIPKRESPWDLLVTRDGIPLDALPERARVGTTSLRRQIQLRALRPDVEILPLRGNIDTRLRRLNEGAFDAIILAEAGVRRLGLEVRSVSLEGLMVPAIGQGALAIEGDARALAQGNPPLDGVLSSLDDLATRIAVEAERAVQRALSADCVTPLGAYARVDLAADTVTLEGFFATNDGARQARATATGSAQKPSETGSVLAQRLRAALGE